MNIQDRFETGLQDVEQSESFSTFREAANHAERLAQREPDQIAYVYDRMAHEGKAELWHVIDGDLRVVHVREPQS